MGYSIKVKYFLRPVTGNQFRREEQKLLSKLCKRENVLRKQISPDLSLKKGHKS